MNDNQLSVKGLVVLAVCVLFFLYEFFLRTVIGTYQNPLMHDLNLTSFQFSVLSTTIFLLIYGLMQIPAGLIINHIGLKKSLIIGVLCCTVSVIGMSFAYSYSAAVTYRILMGFGASFGFIGMLMAIHDWIPHRYNAIFIGMSQFIGTLGPMIATGPLDALSHSSHISWRDIFLSLGIIGGVLMILIFMLVDNNHQKTGKYVILHKPANISNSIFRLFSRIQPWYIAFLSASLYFAVEYLSENEGRSFLILKGVAPNNAGYMITVAWIGYAIGCPVLGFLSDFFERRRAVLSFCAILSLISTIILLYVSNISYIWYAFFILGFSAGGQTIGFAVISEQFKKPFVAIGFGLNNAMISFLSGINAPIIGLLLDHIGGGNKLHLNDYLYAFIVLLIVSICSLIISVFFLKENYCKSTAEFTILSRNIINNPEWR